MSWKMPTLSASAMAQSPEGPPTGSANGHLGRQTHKNPSARDQPDIPKVGCDNWGSSQAGMTGDFGK